MPGVTVLPISPSLPGFGSPQLGKTTSTLLPDTHQMSSSPANHSRSNTQINEVDPAAIKEHAISLVRKETLGTSSTNMLAVALKQYLIGRDHEGNGELAEAYKHFVMAASLVKKAMDHPDVQRVSLYAGMDGALKTDLGERLKSVEEKLKTFEPVPSVRENTGAASIAERKKALEGSGLSLGSPAALKRFSRTIFESTPPSSPKQISTRVSTPASVEAASSKSVATPVPPSPRTMISPSLPPSRPASPIASFSQFFPTIEELEAPFNVPSNGVLVDITTHPKPTSNGVLVPDQIERTLSSPSPSAAASFLNRPESPNIPSLSRTASVFSILSSSTLSQQPNNKPIIPVSGTTTAHELLEYLDHHKILLLDVRNRSDFCNGHIEYKGAAIACVEPSLFWDENLTILELEQAMSNAPSEERSVFSNRDKFEIVVLYDNHSKDLGASNTPLSILNRLIATPRSSQKLLKRQPMLLVGGYNAWRRAFDPSGVPRTVPARTISSPSSPPLSRNVSNNPFYAKGLASPPQSSQDFVPGRSSNNSTPVHRPSPSLDHGNGHTRFPVEASNNPYISPMNGGQARQPPISSDNLSSSTPYGSFSSPFSYPSLTPISTPVSGIASLPPASIKPSQLSRKRTDYDDPSQDAVSDLRLRTPQIAYPALSNSPMPQPPPPVASSTLERQDHRPRLPTPAVPAVSPGVLRMASTSVFPIHYWAESLNSVCGLHNLGNTCYMNATLQCLYATAPFLNFFRDYPWQQCINMVNPLGSKGLVTKTFESLLKDMWTKRESNIKDQLLRCLTVVRTKDRQYEGNNQHDSQEFLTFLLDKIHEDLNRILTKPTEPTLTPEQEHALELRDPRRAIDEEWAKWRDSNDSIIVDLFQGQFRNRLQCSICQRTSTTYNAFSILQLSIPSYSRGTIHLQDCLDSLFRTEELKGDDRWDCPSCKTKRNATQRLSLARLPPILVIHLKRFQTSGNSAGKVDTLVHCPTRYLEFRASPDMPDEPRGGPSGDPRTQVGPYKYELYAVTNHRGQLNSGHYTAHVQSCGDWYLISDMNISRLTGPVVTSEAYVLFYKRVNR
ncbi:Ubiquitin carboxyl-terminal hydrolase 4 [Termitomyces sp. T112]|nr:Ubiquitin carboxyl-terminal hydrolase 4 [Termitomyces sp. T112]